METCKKVLWNYRHVTRAGLINPSPGLCFRGRLRLRKHKRLFGCPGLLRAPRPRGARSGSVGPGFAQHLAWGCGSLRRLRCRGRSRWSGAQPGFILEHAAGAKQVVYHARASWGGAAGMEHQAVATDPWNPADKLYLLPAAELLLGHGSTHTNEAGCQQQSDPPAAEGQQASRQSAAAQHTAASTSKYRASTTQYLLTLGTVPGLR